MAEQKHPHVILNEIMAEFVEYHTRVARFRKENAEYIQYLDDIGEAQDWKIKPVDPQEIQRGDDLIKKIEDEDLADEIESFEELKYKQDIYHQFRAFSAEGRVLRRRLTEARLVLCLDIINDYEVWVENAKKAIAEGNNDADLPNHIKTIEHSIEQMLLEKAQMALELAATHPNKVN